MRKDFKFVSMFLTVLLCLASVAFGQQTGGGLTGTVKDPKGAIVPGATVTVQGINVGFNRTAQTDSDGVFRLQQVPPGTYKISVGAISGFAETGLDDITVVVEKITTADVTLGLNQNITTVDVTSDPNGVVVDSTDSKVQTNITTQLIDTLPKGVSFTSVLRASPGTRPEPISGQFQIDGASGSENTFSIDGQEVTNFRTGTLNAVNNIPTQLVQEVQVKTSGFEAEHGGASGGVIIVTTKGGTDQWRGEFGTQFEISKLQPGNRFAPTLYSPDGGLTQYVYAIQQPRDKYTNFFPTGTLGGPVIKKRLWFLGSWSPQVFQTTRNTRYFNSLPTNLTVNPLYPQTDQYRSTTTYEYGLARVDASPTNSIRAFATFLYNPSIFDGVIPLNSIALGGTPSSSNLGGTTYTGPALAAVQGGRTNSNTFTSQVNWTPTSKLVASFRYGRGFLNERGTGAYGIPNETRFQCSGFATSIAYTSGSAGCARLFQNNLNNFATLKDVSIRNTYNADLTYILTNFGGSHSFKGGYENGRVDNDVNEGYASTGVVTLQYGREFSAYGVSASCAAIPNCIGIGRLQRFGTLGKAGNRYQALYVQDKWQPTNRLTFNLGVRAEKENLPAFNTGSGRGGTPIQFSFGKKIAPRLGGAFDITGDGKSRIFASYGWFYDRLKFELPRGLFGGDFFRRDYFPILSTHPEYNYYTVARIVGNFTDPIGGGNPSTAGGLSIQQGDFRIPANLTPAQFTALGLPIGGVDPNLKPFRQTEMTVGFERELSSLFVLSARFTRKNVARTIEDQASLGLFEAESYIIGNVGEGFAFNSRQAAGYAKQTKAQRLYKGFEVTLNKRLSSDYFFNVNYTYSRLYGNYSGLASSDEITNGVGRTSPASNRFFDYAVNGYNALGQPDNGLLATDRPHAIKAYGGYNFNWRGSKTNSTELSFFFTGLSGTPQTTFVDLASTSIVLSKRGDLGRTPFFTQTDVNLSHKYRFGNDNRFTVAFDFNVLNVFNQNTVTYLNTARYVNTTGLAGTDIDPNYDDATQTLTKVFNTVLNGQAGAAFAALDTIPGNKNVLYGAPAGYQPPRNVRFGFRFFF